MLAACGSQAAPAPAPERGLLDDAPQLVVATVDGWDGVRAELRRYERDGAGWREVGAPIAAVIGGAGAAWGLGLHPQTATKVEGDGRSPAGAFRIGRAFASLGDAWKCVDDPASAHYNDVLDATGVAVDWASAEDMAIDPYRLVVEIDHNPADVAGAGSCIFLHLWSGPDDGGTLGCTAMAEPDLASLITWLRPGAVYVLLPRAERDAVAAAWRLP